MDEFNHLAEAASETDDRREIIKQRMHLVIQQFVHSIFTAGKLSESTTVT